MDRAVSSGRILLVHDVLRDATNHDSSARSRGVLASYDSVSPSRRATDVDHLEQRVLALERMISTHTLQLATPMDVTKLQFSTRTVVAVVGMCIALAAGQWGLNTRLEATVMNAITANARLQDERSTTLRESIAALQREQAMQKYEMQNIKEMLLKQQGAKK